MKTLADFKAEVKDIEKSDFENVTFVLSCTIGLIPKTIYVELLTFVISKLEKEDAKTVKESFDKITASLKDFIEEKSDKESHDVQGA